VRRVRRPYLILELALLFTLSMLVSQPSAIAQPSPANYVITPWTAKDGLPSSNVLCITQDQQGYLWLGTTSGLVKFDGFQFESWHSSAGDPLLGVSVPALLSARDGSLWVAFEGVSGVSRITGDERVANYRPSVGLPPGAVTALLEDRHQQVWAGGHGGLSVFRKGAWHALGAHDGLPDCDLFSLYEDSHGTIWLGTSAGVFRKPDGAERFTLHDPQATFVQSFSEDHTGTIWITDTQALTRPLTSTNRLTVDTSVRLPVAGWRLLTSAQGDVWIAALGAGLFRVASPGHGKASILTRFPYEARFVGAARSLFEDRDHNLWIGMRRGGLLRLSQTPVLTDIALEGSRNDGVQALASADGGIWVATGHSVNQFVGLDRKTYAFDQPLALFGDHDGEMWIASPRGIGPFRGQKMLPVTLPPSVRLPQVASFAVDGERALWLCVYDQGLFRWSKGVLSHFDDVPAVGGRACNVVYADSRGRIWIGYTGGGAAAFDNGVFRIYGTPDGLAPGSVAAIYESRQNGVMWISTVNGITRVADGKLTTLVGRGLRGNLVPTLVEDNDGYLWVGVNSGAALMRINPKEFDDIADPHHEISYTLLDESDGLLGPLARLSSQTAARGADGRLWFVSGSGMAVIDPRDVPTRRLSVVPHLDRVVVDGKEIDFRSEHVVPPRRVTLQIDYGALNLSSASKLRFRHMLEGLTTDWEQVDASRQATFMNLRPGRYRFRLGVTADGTWSPGETTWDFTVQAPFYQTYWFFSVIAIVVGMVLASLWWLRLRRVKNEFELVLAERSRLSRELHDTTLQSLGAFKLQLELAARQLDPAQQPMRDTLQRLRAQVTECIHGARRAVWELRTPALEVRGLVKAVQEAANSSVAGTTTNVRVSSSGRSRRCSLRVEEQLLRISQEAVSNAIRHGNASEIVITIEYSRHSLALAIRDNGQGFVASHPQAAAGHWGLKNMEERANEIGGKFTISSEPSVGTIVTVSAPI
jgi:signal transduction histidine kinase/ligand-binding sensor domain-containing protein